MTTVKMVKLGTLIKPAKLQKCGNDDYPVLSMTMHNGLVFQSDKFKKSVASQDKSTYKVVHRNQLVIGFPIDEGVLATQRITDAGIVSPAYGIWDVDQTKIIPEFLEYALRCNRAIDYYKAKLRGSTARRRSLPTPTLLELDVPLPDIEQQRLALTTIRHAKNALDSRQAQLTKLDELIKARFVEMFGDPVTNPFNWPTVELGQRCEIITGNTPSRAEPENYGTFIEWIKSDNINTPSTFLTPAQEYLSEVGFQKCRFVESGSLLMTCIAGSLNCIGNVAVTNRRVAFNQQINAITPTCDNVLYLYWLMILSKPAIHKTINMALKGILSKSQLSSIKFPFPSIECQNQFAAFVAEVDKSKVEVQKALDQTQLLFDSLMQQYFG
ncbi:restriction endonuclease subunit S [Faecalibacterium sp. Marseille-P9590]|mgnify:CR=1 FL=1|jgi:type I restriction enzyme S subunit|uniref:restriction endonuclease subunit S n=1 Tax=Faecalibacterium sp. Marseille-P9590 TaxID=2817017 RepID=UPI001F609AA8|nr:restriction endonuclease subunit S [Faecalibacterium sp. Marseille-P9590]